MSVVTLEVALLDRCFNVEQCAIRQRAAKKVDSIDYIVVINPVWIRIYKFGKGAGNYAPWVSHKNKANVVAELRKLGYEGDTSVLDRYLTKTKG